MGQDSLRPRMLRYNCGEVGSVYRLTNRDSTSRNCCRKWVVRSNHNAPWQLIRCRCPEKRRPRPFWIA